MVEVLSSISLSWWDARSSGLHGGWESNAKIARRDEPARGKLPSAHGNCRTSAKKTRKICFEVVRKDQMTQVEIYFA